jgi:hypothetical protein
LRGVLERYFLASRQDRKGTRLCPFLQEALRVVRGSRDTFGIVILTDGEIHDPEQSAAAIEALAREPAVQAVLVAGVDAGARVAMERLFQPFGGRETVAGEADAGAALDAFARLLKQGGRR